MDNDPYHAGQDTFGLPINPETQNIESNSLIPLRSEQQEVGKQGISHEQLVRNIQDFIKQEQQVRKVQRQEVSPGDIIRDPTPWPECSRDPSRLDYLDCPNCPTVAPQTAVPYGTCRERRQLKVTSGRSYEVEY
jgi:hypothetical protein